jgi:NADPH-dependent 2,4-dienoyl-CoA reductase/sulfur reductase-like enzyme
MEAARVLAERGHAVQLFEASDRLGGQINLAVRSPRRRDLQGIIDWRVQELKRLMVNVELNTYVEASELAAGDFDSIIVATGGIPNSVSFPGAQHVLDSWDVISGSKRLNGSVLIFDDHGGTQALDLAEILALAGNQVEIVTPERNLAIEVGGMIASGYFKSLSRQGAKFTILRQIKEVKKLVDGKFEVSLGMEDEAFVETRIVDAVVAETGTLANSEIYDELVAHSTNGGEVAMEAFINGTSHNLIRNPDGKFQLFRIGDAISSRNIHTAMLDAHRICRGI